MGKGMRMGMDGAGAGNWDGDGTQKHDCKAWGNTAQFPALLHFPHDPSKPLGLTAHPLPISALMF